MDYTELQAIWGMNLEKMEENDVRVLAKECEKKTLKPDILSPAVQRTLFMI